jgi:hypothetical protein
MNKLKNTKETEATNKTKHRCEFCNSEFVRESTLMTHMCESKRRWLNKDLQGNRIAFQAWLQFYKKNSASKKKKTYEDFIKSAYYTAFVKFGNHCVDINALNVSRYSDWLVKNQIRIDTWAQDSHYTKYLIEYLRVEDPLDAIARSIETTIQLSEIEKIQSVDYLRYGNSNKICYAIVTGKISPWMLYQTESGVKFMDNLDSTQVKMIIDYIDPEKWALKFHREPENVSTVKELLNKAGY